MALAGGKNVVNVGPAIAFEPWKNVHAEAMFNALSGLPSPYVTERHYPTLRVGINNDYKHERRVHLEREEPHSGILVIYDRSSALKDFRQKNPALDHVEMQCSYGPADVVPQHGFRGYLKGFDITVRDCYQPNGGIPILGDQLIRIRLVTKVRRLWYDGAEEFADALMWTLVQSDDGGDGAHQRREHKPVAQVLHPEAPLL